MTIGYDSADEPYDNPHVPEWNPHYEPEFNPFPEIPAPPVEPKPGSVLGFTKRYREDGPAYSFVALHVGRLGWYLTGPNYAGQPMDWDVLLDFIGGPEEWAQVGRVVTWGRLFG